MSERTEVWEPAGRDTEPDEGDETRVLTVGEVPAASATETRVLPTAERETVDPTSAVPPAGTAPTTAVEAATARGAPDDESRVVERTDDATGSVSTSSASPAGSPKRPDQPLAERVAAPAGATNLVTGRLPLPLGSTAAIVGEYRWIEHALYSLVGRWVVEAPLPAVQLLLDAQSMRHAWHAELWGERLPVLASTDPDRLTLPSPPTAALFRLLGAEVPPRVADLAHPSDAGFEIQLSAEGADVPGMLPRLAALYRVVLPRLVVSYEAHLAATAEPTDGPIIRTLRLVVGDVAEDWRAGERLVERLMTRPHDVAVVVDYLRRLESSLVGAGARSGLVRIPESGGRR